MLYYNLEEFYFMSLWQSTKAFFGFAEDVENPLDGETSNEPSCEDQGQRQIRSFKGSLINGKSRRFGAITEIQVEAPRVYEESLTIAQHLRENRPVIVNLKYMDTDTGRRLVDFLFGSAYSIDGHQMRLGENIFLFVPSSVLIVDSNQKTDLEKGLEQEARHTFFRRAG